MMYTVLQPQVDGRAIPDCWEGYFISGSKAVI
jgi:hypothetical protein